MWVGTAAHGIYSFSGGTFSAPHTGADGLPSKEIRALAVDGYGRLWAATGGGLALRGNGYWLRFTTGSSPLLDNDLRDLAVDGNGRLWIATGSGINILDATLGGAGTWSQQTVAGGLPAADVRALAADPDGTIWAATAAGVGAWHPESESWTVHNAAGGALPGDDTLTIASDPAGRIWVGTASGLAHHSAGTWQSFHVPGSTLDADRVVSVAADGDRLWALAGDSVSVRGVLTGPIGNYIPVINSFTPSQGAPSTQVTISGQHFDDREPGFNTVRFCCRQGTSFQPWHEAHVLSATSTELVVSVPQLVDSGPVEVEAHGLTSALSAEDFELAPVISDLGADCVPLGGLVEIYGLGFYDGGGAAYVKIGDGPERVADYTDPTLIRHFVRPGDTPGPVRVRLTNGNTATSSENLSISRPQLAGTAAQQGIEGLRMIWGKRTLVQVQLQATGGCAAHVDGGTMEWRKTNNTTQTAAYATMTSNSGLTVSQLPSPPSLNKTVNFVADFGYEGIFPLSQYNGARITLKNGPVELLTINMDTLALPFVEIPNLVKFTSMKIAPANYTGLQHQQFWQFAHESMADIARVYPQPDIGWQWGSDAWLLHTSTWHSWGMVDLDPDDSDDYHNIRDTVDDWVDPGGNNQAMGLVAAELYTDGPSGVATLGHPTSVSVNFQDDLAPTFLQEAIHALDWVETWSSNHDSANDHHSRYDEAEREDICTNDLTFRQALLDQLGETRQVVRLRPWEAPYRFPLFGCQPDMMPRSAMSYVPNDNNGNVFLEPIDYDFTLDRILASGRRRERAAFFGRLYAADPTLRLTGQIAPSGTVTPRISYLEPAGEPLSLPDTTGDYRLQIRSAGGDLLYDHAFAARFDSTHGHGSGPARFNLRVPFPAGAVKAEIRHQGTLLWSQTVSPNAPQVSFSGPTGGAYDAGGTVPVTWTATDADGDSLQLQLEYSADGGNTWLLLAPYLTGDGYDWQPGHVPAGSGVQLRLQVSDGFHTTTALSAPFTLNPHPPYAAITAPGTGAVFPEGKEIMLAGTSLTAQGPDTGTFAWSLQGSAASLGSTPAVSYTLGAPGTYVFDLQVTAGGMSATDAVTVTVVGDYDADSMPNEWELDYRLNPLDAADATEDADGDGLTNAREHQLGTNPRVADTDGDGTGDGTEVDAGTDPLIAAQTPPAGPVLDVGTGALAFSAVAGSGPAGSASFWVTNGGTGTLDWTAESDVAWLSVSPESGSAPAEVTVTPSATGLTPGSHNGTVTFTASGAAGSPRTVAVTLEVTPGGNTSLFLPLVTGN